jgi:hypothetical protein
MSGEGKHGCCACVPVPPPAGGARLSHPVSVPLPHVPCPHQAHRGAAGAGHLRNARPDPGGHVVGATACPRRPKPPPPPTPATPSCPTRLTCSVIGCRQSQPPVPCALPPLGHRSLPLCSLLASPCPRFLDLIYGQHIRVLQEVNNARCLGASLHAWRRIACRLCRTLLSSPHDTCRVIFQQQWICNGWGAGGGCWDRLARYAVAFTRVV